MDDKQFAILAQKDLASRASESDLDILYADYSRWREYLIAEKRRIEQLLVDKKADSLKIGNRASLVTFMKFKAEWVRYLNLIAKRLSELKELIKEENEEHNEVDGQLGVLKNILEELRALRADLRKASPCGKDRHKLKPPVAD